MRLNDLLRYIVLGGIFLLPLLPFIVANSLFFPFITGKNFMFRIVTEVVFGAWVLLALRDVRYRPAFSWILSAIAAFLVVIAVSDLFGENIFKSFWSNFERMEGWFTLLHLFAYFLVAGSVMATTRLWGWLAHTSVGMSAIVSLYGIGQLAGIFAIHQSDVRLDATVGNSAYLAIYLVFHIFITLILLARWHGGMFVRYIYFALVALQMFILYHTATRGAILGFIGGVLLTTILLAFFERERKVLRRVSVGIVLLVLILVGSFFAVRDASFVQESPVLSRFANISFTEPTTLSRFTIWGMALEGAKEHPILGWGQENFNLVFNKYFKPVLYNHEPWFDRVHNVVLDWLIAGGIVGLLLYLLILFSSLFYLWRPRNKVYFSAAERSLWTGLLAAYFFHNLFVFDNILSYVLFFSVLAYIHAQVSKPAVQESIFAQPISDGMFRLATPVVLFMMVGSLYFFNWAGLQTANALIQGLSATTVEERITAFERAIPYDALGRQEVAEQTVQFAIQVRSRDISLELKQRMFKLAEAEILEELAYAPDDARLHLFLGSLYDQYGILEKAQVEFEKALELSPNKQRIWYQLAFNHLNLEQFKEAQELFRRAYELERNSEDSIIYYAVGSIYVGDIDLADELLSKIANKNRIVSENLLINAYVHTGLYNRLLELWQARVAQEPNDPQRRLSLAATYLQLGMTEQAIEQIERVIEINPNLKQQGEYYISEIRAGRNPVQ